MGKVGSLRAAPRGEMPREESRLGDGSWGPAETRGRPERALPGERDSTASSGFQAGCTRFCKEPSWVLPDLITFCAIPRSYPLSEAARSISEKLRDFLILGKRATAKGRRTADLLPAMLWAFKPQEGGPGDTGPGLDVAL